VAKHEYRINSADDARRLEHEHHAKDPRKVDRLGKHPKGPKAGHFADGDLRSGGGGSFAVDMTEFQAALTRLTEHCEALTRKVDSAAGLTSDLPDGTGPVASVVGHTFNHRLGSDGGMHYAVRTNLEQMLHILDGLTQTRTNYQQAEDATTDAITGAPGAGL
jgi:hypothetical protein